MKKLKGPSLAFCFAILATILLLLMVSTFDPLEEDYDKVKIILSQVTTEKADLDGNFYYVNYIATIGNITKDTVLFMFEINILDRCGIIATDTSGPYTIGPAPSVGNVEGFVVIDYCIKHNMTGADLIVTELEKWNK